MPASEVAAVIGILILVVGIGCILFASFHLSGKSSEQRFPPVPEQDVVFRERGVSGNVTGSWAGASNALEVTVTPRELHIKGIYPLFTSIGEAFDMIHCVPISDVTSVSLKKQKVEISFRKQNGRPMSMSLYLRNPSRLMEVLGAA